MSIIVKSKFKCPHCEQEFESDMYKGVVVTEDAKYRDMLINGDYFKYICPHCGKTMMAVYPLLYTDPVNKFMIQYAPREIADEMAKLIDKNRNTFPSDFSIRLVRAPYDAVEKMIIFENRFDDRVIEMTKVIIHKAFLDKYGADKRVSHIYFNIDSDKNFTYDVLIKNEDGKQEIMRSGFDKNLYNRIYKDFRRDFKDEDLIIDYSYGLKKMQQGPKKDESKEN